MQVVDPAEEELPYKGRVLFEGTERDGTALIDHVGGVRARYDQLFRAHRESLAGIAGRQGWRFTAHRTDATAETALLALMGMLAPAHGRLTMLSLGVLAFTQPWLLLAGLSLPALWLLLRVTPPAPRRISFPPLLLLAGLVSPERTPARTPWWLLLLDWPSRPCSSWPWPTRS